MRTDIDLEFLQYCSNTELRELCDMLTIALYRYHA